MYVLEVMSCIEYGGTEAFVFNHSKEILRTHPECKIGLLICGTHINSERKKDFEDIGIGVETTLLPNLRNYSVIKDTLSKIQQEHKIDAIHCHMNLGNYVVMAAAKKVGIPIRVAHSHATVGFSGNGAKRLFQQYKADRIAKWSTVLAACSREAGEYMYGTWFDSKGIVIANGIEAGKYTSPNEAYINQLRQEYELDGKFVVGNISRFDENKNHRFLVDVFYEFVQQHVDSVLVLGGADAGTEHEIRVYVISKRIEDKVRFIGVRKDVAEWMHVYNLWVLPSIREGLGIVLIEAQFSGLRCLVSSGVASEADCGYGLIDFEDFADRDRWIKIMDESYTNRVRDSLEEIHRQNLQSKYNVERSAMKLFEMYLEVR